MLDNRQNINNFCNIQFCEEFLTTISKERSRADRNKHRFLVLVFEVDFESTDFSMTTKFLNQVCPHIRVYDEVGWFNKKSIGLILHDSTFKGAKRIIDELKQVNDIDKYISKYNIYQYP